MYEAKEMRAVLAELFLQRMAEDPRCITIDADLAKANGTGVLRETYPECGLDVGIAEANMACVAAGLASYGFTPYIFSFCAFVTRRLYDQAAVSIAYAKQNVKLIGTDPGITAELNGGTHMSVEDVAIMRAIPNMVIFEPVDGDQLAKAMPQIFAYEGPVYIRIFRKVPPATYFASGEYQFDLFRADKMKDGTDVTLLATGIETHQAMLAAAELEKQGISAEVINVHTIKPLDEQTIVDSIRKTGCAVTCENASVVGGLGGAVCELLAKTKPAPVECIGIQDHFGEVGKLPYLQEKFKMMAGDIAKAAQKAIDRKKA